MRNQRNIIGKQFLDVSAEEVNDPFLFKDQVSLVCTTKLIPAIEKVLDDHSPTDKNLFFEKMELNVGNLAKENWGDLLVEKVAKLLVDALSKSSAPDASLPAARGISMVNFALEISEDEKSRESLLHFLRTGLLPWNSRITEKSELINAFDKIIADRTFVTELVTLLKSDDHAFERLIQQFSIEQLDNLILNAIQISKQAYYDLKRSATSVLQMTGVPLHARQKMIYEILLLQIPVSNSSTHAERYNSLVSRELFNKISLPSIIKKIFEEIDGGSLFRKERTLSRLQSSSQVSSPGELSDDQLNEQLQELRTSYNHIINTLLGQFSGEQLNKIVLASIQASGSVPSVGQSFDTILTESMKLSAEIKRKLIYQALSADFIRRTTLSEPGNQTWVILEDVFRKLPFPYVINLLLENSKGGPMCHEVAQELKRHLGDRVLPLLFSKSLIPSAMGPQTKDSEVRPHEDVEKHARAFAAKKLAVDSPGQEWFVNNSGLVLLHPFLTNLFGNVGYTESNSWINKSTQSRAIVLSQFLVTGRTEYAEFELLLNKVLIGYPLHETLSSEIVLSEFEMREARDMLHAAIRHWAALGKTSIEGLQNTFISRDGKLFKNETGWNLTVERKTVDILINRIPWAFSVIKTPWMTDLLKVEWT